MIHEVDAALEAMVTDELADAEQLEISFEAPTSEWAARRNAPAVDVYLYDVRQDTSRNQFGKIPIRDEAGRISAMQPIPQWFRLAYLVTAWTQRPVDEHRLLADLLRVFLAHDTLPAHLLEGSLADLETPIPLGVAMPPPQDRALSDIWSALGGELKPSLDIVVIAPLVPESQDSVGPPVTQEPIVRLEDGAPLPPYRGRHGFDQAGGRDYPATWDPKRPPRRRPPVRLPAEPGQADEAFERLRETFGDDEA